ncbi:NET1-associated nuclear protein 1 (U3 small nucleolar RNA-associated protein 17) [Paragonimus westermani]|uniref:NET1-associated nuclear protein 1 (U3 small nucleolar RNA-associated protein 17) n=1 Tax=Paragonimus westermani TaxID=34504 RepID=A0A5J4NLB1_9TREM|nr:NET1-associated nuclear protein 1 (U3 small nucleolar RNA-associated protein 17) [Paragonimus westermani]
MTTVSRFTRASASVINASPIYHKDLNLLIYASDKLVILMNVAKSTVQKLQGHSDSVTALNFKTGSSHVLVSAGLDGRLIEWDLRTGERLKQTHLKFPIFSVRCGVYVGHETKNGDSLRKYDVCFETNTSIYDSPETFQYSIGGEMNEIVAYVQGLNLFIFWENFNETTCYTLTSSKCHEERKQLTCVATHPTELIVATGNRIGEIFLWYNLASSTDDVMDCLSDMDDGVQPQQDSFERMRLAVQVSRSCGKLIDYYPVHPSRVNRNLVHWHSCSVTTLCFTPSGSHLLSGGLEGVLVKWDMTECLGGSQHRRFLPHLGSPIVQVTSPGGASEDTVVVTLEHNAFHLLTGALERIYSHQGFIQSPKSWRFTTGFKFPTNLVSLPRRQPPESTSGSPLLLASGAMGSLQLLTAHQQGLFVSKIDVTRQALIPRDNDPKFPVAFSEVLLVSQCQTANGFSWVATYERMLKLKNKQVDDAARITWWKYHEPDTTAFDSKKLSCLLIPVASCSLSYLNCPVSDMGFVNMDNPCFYLLLKDFRMLIFENCTFRRSDGLHWVKRICLQLSGWVPGTVTASNVQATVISTKDVHNSNGFDDHLFLLNVGKFLVLFNWIQLFDDDCPKPVCTLDLSTCSALSDYIPTTMRVVGKPTILHKVDVASSAIYFTVCLRGYMRANKAEKNKLTGCACLMQIRPRAEQRWMSMELIDVKRDLLATCMSAHPERALVAIGFRDGTVAVYNIVTDETGHKFNQLKSLPGLPAHPLCDHHKRARGGVKSRNMPRRPTTRLAALEFLQSSTADLETFQMAGLLKTLVGRDRGRRDLVLYNTLAQTQVESDRELD